MPHHRRALGDLGENSNTWRENGTWIYANHNNPLILSVVGALVYQHWGDETLSTISG